MGNLYQHFFLVSPQDVVLDGDVPELACTIETLHVTCGTDVDAPAVVQQLVAADEDIAHEVVAIEASPSIAVGEVVQNADVACALYADAVIAPILHDVAPDDLSLALCHRCPSVHTVAKARLVFYEDAVVATPHTDAVRDDEVLVLIASQSYAYAATATFAFRPVASAFYHTHIVYQYTIEEVHTKCCGWSATQDEVVEDGIRQWSNVESLAVRNVG